jgi:peptide/nickel transport system substrate-binding protein
MLAMGAAAASAPVVARICAHKHSASSATNLSVLDPVFTTATVTGNHGWHVLDTLYGVDIELKPKPQMAEGAEVLDDGKRWRITLRAGLRFHDGEPVRARDCIASLKRWCAREPYGQLLVRWMNGAPWMTAPSKSA